MQDIEIKNRRTEKIIITGKYESIKDCLEKNRGADLQDADLQGAYLRDADLQDADLQGAYLRDADLRDADLQGAYLRGADLQDADLQGAYLRDADLRDAKNYVSNHDFWLEIIRRQKVETFSEKEWSIIGQVYTHRLCWDSIKKRYGKDAMPIFEKLSTAGFDEWKKEYDGKLLQKP